MRRDRLGAPASALAGILLGPTAGGQLALLTKPFGGVLGLPGEVVGYIALTMLVLGCASAAATTRLRVSSRGAGWCTVVAGAALVAAGTVSSTWGFTITLLSAGVAAGPVVVRGRARVLGSRAASLTVWHVCCAAGFAGAAGLAALCASTPGSGVLGTGVVTVLCGALMLAAPADSAAGTRPTRYSPSPARDSAASSASPHSVRSLLPGYAAVGLTLGGVVLPALHLLLFRWNALGAEQAVLLLATTLPALVVLALPGPNADALAVLLVLAAGGALLVATAPGRVTLTIGLGLTLAASARAARGLDLVLAERHRGDGAAATAISMVLAGLAGLGLVTVLAGPAGVGTGVTLLALPALLVALYCGSRRLAPRSALPAPILEGGAS
ncbi:hypothetical protein [Nocardia jejuensis]|uniref:hypothetical protein n=1 Tax=Nocardia jejuensis TaxID=328049 RepID=UPI000830A3C0|nr:hypothetical protein [Nocardia jejuensis]